MKIIACLFVALVIPIVVITAQQCTKASQDFFAESADYINCLGVKMKKEFKNLGTNRDAEAFVDNKEEELSGYFEDSNCPLASLDMPITEFLGIYGAPKIVIELQPSLESVVWRAAKYPKLSQCIAEYMRRNFLQYIRGCTGANSPSKGRRPVVSTESISNSEEIEDNTSGVLDPVPIFVKDEHDLEQAQRYVELLIKVFMALANCKEKDRKSYREIMRSVTAEVETDICDCAKDSYDTCKATYNSLCSVTAKCIEDIAINPDKVMNFRVFQRKAANCLDAVRDIDSDDKAAFTDDGLKLLRGFVTLLKKKGTPEYKKFGELIRGLIQAFMGEFCERCTL